MDKSSVKQQTTSVKWKEIERYVRSCISGLADKPMQVQPFSAGYSNLTYQISIGDWTAVFRRPPFGHIPPKAHDMKREYTILKKLHPVFSLAPKPYLYCDDPAVSDKHFYIMEKKSGLVLDDTLPPEHQGDEAYARAVSGTAVSTLAQLHSIDYAKEGLADIGRPDGYLERQVHGWIKRYQLAKTEEIAGVTEIEQWLMHHLPASPAPAIVHNDFKLNNMMLSPDDPTNATAVFDWEMCTIGDPLTDLGCSLAYWTEPGEAETGLVSVTIQHGFLNRREFAHLYAAKSGRDLSNIDYHLTFAFYKIAVVLQQLHYRWKKGETSDDRFSTLNIGVYNLMCQAHRARNKELL
ncbi:phosphotransferase family protein [Aneurinibacillus sp. Ricciae_BoGa-3]|uniref:phosphotransferase family protein n=1 Tax=Aneurinibacillus sp. Ricciae_BoGa-3 TaxID=3022697 RepID=UPI00233FE773|nr:phosphotransferase family protein [Aneurinibacillus sp. Ricciae_BoGa-3]WCK55703.1 phosphotransferase family protein [Aneurinibacillus sp. Ricciae_BoGa-3]